ncbi:hypothetical protein KCP70_21110 [Salmonella enterica subsp. enterica]|nr:hypothetical protein KCP70_21110 [Salmonella enterica subsp. enterica]
MGEPNLYRWYEALMCVLWSQNGFRFLNFTLYTMGPSPEPNITPFCGLKTAAELQKEIRR